MEDIRTYELILLGACGRFKEIVFCGSRKALLRAIPYEAVEGVDYAVVPNGILSLVEARKL